MVTTSHATGLEKTMLDYIPPARVGNHANFGILVGTARVFGYQLVGISKKDQTEYLALGLTILLRTTHPNQNLHSALTEKKTICQFLFLRFTSGSYPTVRLSSKFLASNSVCSLHFV